MFCFYKLDLLIYILDLNLNGSMVKGCFLLLEFCNYFLGLKDLGLGKYFLL